MKIKMKKQNTRHLAICLIAGIIMLFRIPVTSAAEVTKLRCEYLADPLGIDVPMPRLSWIIESERRGDRQTAYQVLVASSEGLLNHDKGDVWDSGKVASDQSIQVEYAGSPLKSRMRCYWKVRVWTMAGDSWSKPAAWTMGLLKPEDWQAKWIGLEPPKDPSLIKVAKWIWFPEGEPVASAPVGIRYFRRNLTLPDDRIISNAVCQITADNAFELFVNGTKVGQGADFHDLPLLDVTKLLKRGVNSIAVMAANTGDTPTPAGLIAALRVTFAQGEPLVIQTDEQWKVSQERKDGWEKEGFDDSPWSGAKVLGDYGMNPWGVLGAPPDRQTLPARYLRREFPVGNKVARATAYVCGLGFFDLYLNEKKVSDHAMDPVLSDYRKAAHYVTFDVTTYLQQGNNAMGVVLGNGRFFAPRLHSPAETMNYGYPKLFLQTEIVYEDGTSVRIVSDDNWKLTQQGPIRANNEYDGEQYDARMEMEGWNRIGFNDAKWENVQRVNAPGGVFRAQMMEPMRVTQTIKPVAVTQPKPGVYIVDMGQNFYGTFRMKARGPRGTEVHLVSAYSLLPDGTLKTADNRGASASDVYTLKGEGEEVWNPQFKGQGYRHIQVTGFPGTPTAENFEGWVIHTDFTPVGGFWCSNKLVNRIHDNIRWTQRAYIRSAPLEPDRDERQPWLGDPAKDAESEAFNYHVAAFYTKWMADLRRSQRPDGSIPDLSMNWEWGTGVLWPSVVTIIPEWLYDFYGDRTALEENYETIRKWMMFHQKHLEPDYTVSQDQYGDWCDASTMDKGGISDGITPRPVLSTAYYYNNCRIAARLANQLGKPDDEKLFMELGEKVKAGFNTRFMKADGTCTSDTQCAYVLVLKFGLVSPEKKDAMVARLVDDIMVKNKGHLTVGLIGMQWLMQVLTEIGRPDVGYIIATQTTRPSWGYMIEQGATTIWERWDCDTQGSGMNSEALLILAGNLDAWFYQTLGGINNDPAQPAFKQIIIKPMPVGDLTWVKAHHDSLYGRIVSNWKREGRKLTMEVTIPANTTATVFVPAKDATGVTESGKPADKVEGVKFLRMENSAAVYGVGAGTYRFESTPP